MDESYYRLHAEHEETYWWFVAKNRIIMAMLDRYGPPSGPSGSSRRACDVGCGAGGLLSRLVARFDAVGVDCSPLALDYCAKRGLKAVAGGLPGPLPLEPGAFGAVVASEVIEHVAEDRAAVESLARLLAPGGVLVCTVPAHQWLWSSHDELNHHCRRYHKRKFAALFEGLPLERLLLGYYQTALFPLMVAERLSERLGLVKPRGDVPRLPGAINSAFRAAFEHEKHALGRVPLPIGGSLISVHRRA